MRWRSTPGPRSHTTNLWPLRLVRLRTDTEILIGSLSQSDTEIGHIQAKRVAHRDSKQGCVPFLCILCGLSYFFCHTTQFNPVVLVQVSQRNRNTSLCGSNRTTNLKSMADSLFQFQVDCLCHSVFGNVIIRGMNWNVRLCLCVDLSHSGLSLRSRCLLTWQWRKARG